jgi:hypothetical protein
MRALGGSGGEGDAGRGHTHPRQRGGWLLSRVASRLYEDRQQQQRGHDQVIPRGPHAMHAPVRVGGSGSCCDGAGSLNGAPNTLEQFLFVS